MKAVWWIFYFRKIPILQVRDILQSGAGLAADSTVALVGRHSHFEIWNAENFETAREIECREIADDAFGVL